MSDEPASTCKSARDWFSPGRFALVLAVLVFIPFSGVLLGKECFIIRDFGLFSLPVASFFRDSFWRGEWPLWNPLSCCGMPFLAQLNTLTLYPPSLIYLVFPLTWSLPFFCLLHLFFGGLGMYFLAARWSGSRLGGAIAGTIFGFNGLTFNFMMWPSHIATFALLPWVVFLAEDAWQSGGRKIILAALAAAFQVLAGGPETIMFTWLLLGGLAAIQFQKAGVPRAILVRRFFAVGFIALGLAAAQLAPFVDFSIHSNRTNQFGGADWPMPPCGWANFFVPIFQTDPWQKIVVQSGQYWTSSYYAGIGAVFLAAIAFCRKRTWRVGLLGLIVFFSVDLALGGEGHLLNPLRKLLPFLGLFRYPVKFVMPTLWALPLLAAFAIQHFENWKPRSPRVWWPELSCLAAILLIIGLIIAFDRLVPSPGTPWPMVAANGLDRALFLLLIVAILYLVVTRPRWRAWTGIALMAALWLDVLLHLPWQNPTVDPSLYQPGLALMKVHFKPEPVVAGESRIMMSPYSAKLLYYDPDSNVVNNYLLDRVVFIANCNLLDHVPKVDGFFSLYLRHIDQVLALFDNHSATQLARFEDVMSVSQTIAAGRVFDWVPRPTHLPWITIGQAPLFADDDTILRALANTNSDFRQNVYLPPEAKGAVTAQRAETARILSKQFGATKILLTIDTPAPTMVVLSQAWYHNWKSYVDGKAAPLWRANCAFQAVEVPAGHHELKLAYEDIAFRAGGLVSCFTLFACLIFWLRKSPGV